MTRSGSLLPSSALSAVLLSGGQCRPGNADLQAGSEEVTSSRRPETIGTTVAPDSPPGHLDEVHRFKSMLWQTVLGLDALPPSVCPNDEAVVSFWFRQEGRHRDDLLHAMRRIAPIRVVGSRPPRPGPSECAAEWFLAGSRATFRQLLEATVAWRPSQRRIALVGAVARITPPVPDERLRVQWVTSRKNPLEVVLHAGDGAEVRHIVEGFRRYLWELGLRPRGDRVLFTRRFAFLGLKADAGEALDVARFAFVRLVREMPGLRLRRPTSQGSSGLGGLSLFGVPSRVHPTENAAPHPLPPPPTTD